MSRLSMILLVVCLFGTALSTTTTTSTTSAPTTTTTTSSSTSTTTTSTTTSTETPKILTPKVETREGDLHVILPHQQNLYFRFQDEDGHDQQVYTLQDMETNLKQYSDARLQDANDYTDDNVEILQQAIQQLRTDAAMDADVQKVANDLSNTNQDLSILNGRVTDVKNEAAQARSDLSDDIQDELNRLEGDIGQNTQSINTNKQNEQQARQQLETTLTNAITDESSKWNDLLNDAKTKLGQDLNGVKTELTRKINDDVDDVQTQVDGLKTSTDDVKTLLTALTNQVKCKSLTYSTKNSASGICEAPGNPFITRYFGDTRVPGGHNYWETLPGRTATYVKQGSMLDSVVLFHYQDSLGIYDYSGGSYPSCIWRVLVDGQQYSSLSSHDGSNTNWDIWPGRMMFPFELSQGPHTFEIQVYRRYSSSCLAGWENGRQENHMMFEEVDRNRMGFRKDFGDHRLGSRGAWNTIPNRVLTYKKLRKDTDLHVFWTDVMGYHQTSGHGHSCHIRMMMSGPGLNSVHLGQNGAYSVASSGWKIRPRSVQYYIPTKDITLNPGTYTFTAQYFMDSQATECLQGWEAHSGNIVVVEKDPKNIVHAPANLFSGVTKRYLPDSRVFGGWTTITQRTVQHTKKSASSIIRVTYMDTLGWNGGAASKACTWGLWIDNSNLDSRFLYTHSSNRIGTWNIDPYSIVWMPTVSPGTHTYVIKMNKDTARECLAGWRPLGGEPQNNFLLVEEIDRDKGSVI